MPQDADILIIDRKIDPQELSRLAEAHFHDMVKLVVDVRRRVIGIGGEVRDITFELIGCGEEES